MKKIFIPMMGLLFTAAAVFASPNAKVDIATLNNSDSQMLFGDISDMNIITLGSAEMEATEGKWGFLIPIFKTLLIGWAAKEALNAPSWGEAHP